MLFLFGLLILFHSSLGSFLNENEAMMALEMSSLAYKNFGKGKDSTFGQLSASCVEELLRVYESEEEIELSENLKNVYKSSEKHCELIKFTSIKSNASWGIVGVELDGKPQIYVTFRGTISLEEIKLDLNFKAVENDDLGVYVHEGMNNIFTEYNTHKFILIALYEQWQKMTTKFESNVQLIVTGHSLGGGLAQIFAAYISREFDFESLSNKEDYFEFMKFVYKSRTYTFGSPQVFRLYEKKKFGTGEGLSANHIQCLGESLIPRWVEKVEQSSVHFINEHDAVPVLNLLRERSIVNIVEASKSKITENSPGLGVWQLLKAKEWKKFICGVGSAIWTLGSDLSSCVINELCFDSSYKQWGTILYYTDEAQFYTKIDLKELKSKAGSIKDINKNWKWWKHLDITYRKQFAKSSRTLHNFGFGSPLHMPKEGWIDIETISELQKLRSEKQKTIKKLQEKKNEWEILNQKIEVEKLKAEDLSLCVDEQIEVILFDNKQMGFEENKKSPRKNYSKGILNNSFPPDKTKQDQAQFDAIECFQNPEKTIETKQEDFVKQFETATDAAQLRLEEQQDVVRNLQLARNKVDQEYYSLDNKLMRTMKRIETIEHESEKYLKAIEK